MKRRSTSLFLLLGIFAFNLQIATPVRAACGDRASGTADTYKVTVTKLEMTTDGTTFVTAFSGSQEIDIASVNAGAVAAGLVTGTAIPPGDYIQVRVTTAATLKVQGYVNNGATTVYTDGGTDAAGFTGVAGNDAPGGDCAESTFTIPDSALVGTDNVRFTVGGENPSVVSVAFDTTGVIVAQGAGATINEPVVTMSAN